LARANVTAEYFCNRSIINADGNFLYLATLCRGIEMLSARVEGGTGQPTADADMQDLDSLLKGHDLLTGLDDLYVFFLTTIRDRIAAGTVDVREGRGLSQGIVAKPKWESLHRPILGLLCVAMEPMIVDQLWAFGDLRIEQDLVVRALQGDLSQFLTNEGGRYRFYHYSLAEFVTADRTKQMFRDCYLHAPDWHLRLARHYRDQAASWDSVDWSGVDDYGIWHLAEHLYPLRDDAEVRPELYGLKRCDAIEAVVPALVETKDLDGLRSSFTWARNLAVDRSEDSSLQLHVSTLLHSVAVGLARLGDSDSALEAVNASSGGLFAAEALGSVGQVFSSNRDEDALKRAWELARAISPAFSRAVALKGIAQVWFDSGEAQNARSAAQGTLEAVRAFDFRASPIRSHRSWAISLHSELGVLLIRLGEAEKGQSAIDQALDYARTLSPPKERAEVLSTIATGLANAGQADRAAEVALSAFQAGFSFRAFRDTLAAVRERDAHIGNGIFVAASYALRSGTWEEATYSRLLDRGRSLARQADYPQPKAMGLLEMATVSEAAEAVEAGRQALRCIRDIPNRYVGTDMLADVFAYAVWTRDSRFIAEVITVTAEAGWTTLMAALERAAGELVAAGGAGIVAQMDAAFRGALQVLDERPSGYQQPAHIDGVAAPLSPVVP
jgi:hypothetical protein